MENAVKELDASLVKRSESYEELIRTIFIEQNYLASRLFIYIEDYGTYHINDQDLFSQAKSYIGSNFRITFLFEYIHQAEITGNLDFFIVSESGIPQCSTIKIGKTLTKEWLITATHHLDSVFIICTEGEFKGQAFIGTHLDQTDYKFIISIPVQGTKRWSSSLWKVYCQGYFFGPLLWLDAYFE